MKDKDKKIIILLIMFTVIFIVIGSSFAYLRWQTSTDEQTSVTFTVEKEFSCGADGGNELSSSSILLEPTTCDDSASAIKREITLKPVIDTTGISIYMDVWLDVISLGEGLKNSDNFKWVLSNSPTSCSGSAIESEGTFKGKVANDKVLLLEGKTYTKTANDKHYLYIWLDKEETSTSTMNQSFEFKLNGECGLIEEKPITFAELSNNYSCDNNSAGSNPIFTYTGDCEVVDDGDDNWKVRFLSNGTLTVSEEMYIDVFLVGGGGGGDWAGGGGGYTTTKRWISINEETEYQIKIGTGGTGGNGGDGNSRGASGGNTSGFGYEASGGGGANNTSAGTPNGGSGGNGTSNGGKGGDGTIEFNNETGDYYGGGGGGASRTGTGGAGGAGGGGAGNTRDSSKANAGKENTGGGGGGTHGDNNNNGGKGGSGIVIIRNSRSNGVPMNFNYKCDNQVYGENNYLFEYTGDCEPVSEENNENWKLKFLSNGTLTVSEEMYIDAFLVGGGGGGDWAGGGGGYATMAEKVFVTEGTLYEIKIGTGGTGGNGGDGNSLGASGGNTSGFGYEASGGGGANNTSAGTPNGGGGGNGTSNGGKGGDGTIEFNNETGDYYGGGGGGASRTGTGGAGGAGGGGAGNTRDSSIVNAGKENTGGGGGGTHGDNNNNGGKGGSGIVIIRNTRSS